jgi:uncharacterized membrane protein YqjE
MINLIVAGVSLLALLFVVLWLFVPRFRNAVEQPKYRMLENERRFRQRDQWRL